MAGVARCPPGVPTVPWPVVREPSCSASDHIAGRSIADALGDIGTFGLIAVLAVVALLGDAGDRAMLPTNRCAISMPRRFAVVRQNARGRWSMTT
jgi:hypothetical protein